MKNDIYNKINDFITNHFLIEFDDTTTKQTNLFKSGFIDSFGFLELVTFLENTFQIKITDKELVSEDLISLANIESCIHRKLNDKSK